MTIAELRQRRASLWEQAKSLHILAEKEKRELTAEEREQWDRINAEIDGLKETIDREERIAEIDSELNDLPEPVALRTREGRIAAATGSFEHSPVEMEESVLPQSDEYNRAFRSYLRVGMGSLKPESRAILQPFFGATDTEQRALGVGTAAAGGALVPEEFYRQVIDAMKAFGGMRQARTTKISTASGANMPIPTADDTGNEGAILAENTQVGEQDMTFGSKNLGAYMYTSKLVRVSLQLMQDAAFPIATWLAQKLGQRLGRITNKHYTIGTGTGEPAGILTGATLGSLGAAGATTTITYEKLVELEHSVDPPYREQGAEWMFNDKTLQALKSLKDGDGRPLWLPGLAVQSPDTIMGYPYIINQSMPAMGVDAKSILFGDFSYYFIRDVMDLRVLRLDERYADYLQVGFLAFMRSDGIFANPDGGSTNSPVKFYQNSAT
jgi:HK97 family phage major capsid protein